MTPLTLTRSNDWIPEQALAPCEMVDALREVLWSRHNLHLIEQVQEDPSPPSRWVAI